MDADNRERQQKAFRFYFPHKLRRRRCTGDFSRRKLGFVRMTLVAENLSAFVNENHNTLQTQIRRQLLKQLE